MPPLRMPVTIAVPTNNSKSVNTDIRWFTSRYSIVKVLNQETGHQQPRGGQDVFSFAHPPRRAARTCSKSDSKAAPPWWQSSCPQMSSGIVAVEGQQVPGGGGHRTPQARRVHDLDVRREAEEGAA